MIKRTATAGQTCIYSIGTATPERRVSSHEYAEMATRVSARIPREAALIHAIARQSGISYRHTVVQNGNGDSKPGLYETRPEENPWPGTAERMEEYARHAPRLAQEAAESALADAAISPQEITHIITASCTGFYAPGLDRHLIEALDLPLTVGRTHVGFMGCHAAINALSAARAFAESSPDARVLVVCVELCTLHFQRGIGRHIILPNALFGDGAAAVIIGGKESGAENGGELLGTASTILPETEGMMSWKIGDTGFRMTLDSAVPDQIQHHIRPFVEQLLARHGLTISDVAGWAIHPGGPRVVESVLRGLSLPASAGEASRSILDQYGNMSSPTVLFIVKELIARGVKGPIVLMAFGPGLAAEAALISRLT